MSLFNAYKYLYYRIYSWNLRTWGENDLPQFNSLFGISFLMFMNIYTLFIGTNFVTGFSVVEQLNLDKLRLIIIMGIIGFVNYFIFIYKNNYNSITKQFKKEGEIHRKRNFYLCLAYTIISSTIFIIFALVSPKGTKFLITAN